MRKCTSRSLQAHAYMNFSRMFVCTQRTHEIPVGPNPSCAIYLSHSAFLLLTALYAASHSPVPLPAMAKRSVGFPLQDRLYGMKPRYFGMNRISMYPWKGLQVIYRLFACKSQRNCLKGSTPACCFAARKGIAECATVSQGLIITIVYCGEEVVVCQSLFLLSIRLILFSMVRLPRALLAECC